MAGRATVPAAAIELLFIIMKPRGRCGVMCGPGVFVPSQRKISTPPSSGDRSCVFITLLSILHPLHPQLVERAYREPNR